uniref:Uncharacterized protein n=1 Tax=Arion vulgaris TaxID=1028688 RepID=A0A0B6ZHT8_9EUPU
MADNVDYSRRQSILPRDVESMTSGPNIRRMSRMDARPSIQYGLSGRRMSQFSRSSISGLSFGLKDFKAPVQLQNTYRMTPAANQKFQPKKAEDLMKSVLQSYLGGENTAPIYVVIWFSRYLMSLKAELRI